MLVEFQQLVDADWVTIETVTTGPEGVFEVVVKMPTEKGLYKYRAYFENGVTYESSSDTVSIEVRERIVKKVPGRLILRVDADKLEIILGETVILFGTLSFIGVTRALPVPFIRVRGLYDETEIEPFTRTNLLGKYEIAWTPQEAGVFTVYTQAFIPYMVMPLAESNLITITVS